MKKVLIIIGVVVVGILVLLMYLGGAFHFKHTNVTVGREPTCTEEGYEAIECSKCGQRVSYTTLKPLGHVGVKTKEGRAATCTSTGLTDELTCSRCKQVYQQQSSIDKLPHNYTVAEKGVEPTCDLAGKTDALVCSSCGDKVDHQEIAPKGHADLDADLFCDECGLLVYENPTEIGTVEDLKTIRQNLNEVFVLTADIDLSNEEWIPIGTKVSPFTGTFFGNGYVIKNLHNDSSYETGLFGCNQGKLYSVKVENYTAEMDETHSVVGGIVAVNQGVVKDCSVTGSLSITYTNHQKVETTEKSVGTRSYNLECGLLCGRNENLIQDCSVSGAIIGNYDINANLKVNKGTLTVPTVWSFYVKANVSFGGIAGTNKGTIDNSVASTSGQSIVTAAAASQTKWGYCDVKTDCYMGSIAGVNEGTISHVKGTALTVIKNEGATSISYVNIHDSGYKTKLEIHEEKDYKGVIANNKGTITEIIFL